MRGGHGGRTGHVRIDQRRGTIGEVYLLLPLGTGLSDKLCIDIRTLALMQLSGQQRQLLATPGSATCRHPGVLIPVQRALDGAEKLGFPQMRTQLFPGRCGGRHPVEASAPTLTSMSGGSVAPSQAPEPR